MQLTSYISELLYRYECVIIPGFGAFLTHQESAWIDQKSNTFHPPHKRISFNRQLQTNDGLAANYIATAEKTSYENALTRLRTFARELNSDLQKGKTITFERIGEFTSDEEGNVFFIPNNLENFSTDAFGLASFVMPKVKRLQLLEEVKELEEKAPIIFTPEKRNKPNYLKYAAVAAIALIVGGIGGLKWYESDVQKENYAERQKANSLLENKIQEATFIIENPLPALNLHINKQAGDFHLVAGAFKEEENALKKISQLKERGYHPRIVKTRYGLHQVLYNSYETKHDALQALNLIKQQENPDVWLLIQKLEL